MANHVLANHVYVGIFELIVGTRMGASMVQSNPVSSHGPLTCSFAHSLVLPCSRARRAHSHSFVGKYQHQAFLNHRGRMREPSTLRKASWQTIGKSSALLLQKFHNSLQRCLKLNSFSFALFTFTRMIWRELLSLPLS